ncbi:TRAP transporter small permease subunit [Azospirillum halopraeferens]|uniref:TRAP transporter small permease subunit n=1 Tax=Azospirillum halopraeferens TaxID=34010 RepID=UPI000685C0C6|nr:TRAP transporter small permease [Azospirillum halopraeferens]
MTTDPRIPPRGSPALAALSDTDAGQQPLVPNGRDGHIRSTLDAVIAEGGRVVAWLVLVAAVVSVYEVGMRYLLDSPTSWVHETTVFLIAIIFALGGPIALARDKHIRVRLIYDAVPPRARRWLDVVNSVITVVFLAGMTFAAWSMVYTATHAPTGAIQLERSGTSWNPPFPAWIKIMILLSVAIMLVQTLIHLVQALRGRGYDGSAPGAAPKEG